MTASFERIDYSLRPAKHAERRMLCDIFRRLRPFGRIEEYVYVGFGSVWFADFALFHRALGIKKMISIEAVEDAQQRIEDNRPFRIPVDFRHSRDALPDLDWARKQFLWLDYDDPLSLDMLLDMRTVARRATSGTLLAITVQCSKAPQLAQADQDPAPGAPTALQRFLGAFGRNRVPHDAGEDDFRGWPFGLLSRKMLSQEIMGELASRNSGAAQAKMVFQPICEFEYEDGAKMTTLVGIFHLEEDLQKFEQCNFNSLDFLPEPKKKVRIAIPKITAREFKKLESQLPLTPDNGELELGSIPATEARHFATMYRYLPNFAVVEG